MSNAETYIESRQNPRLKELVRLRERKHRERQERFPVEGYRELSHAVAAAWSLQELYFCPELFPDPAHGALISTLRAKRDNPTDFFRLSIGAFEKISGRQGPDGLLAICGARTTRLEQLKLQEAALLFIVEGIEKPGNLGAMLRTADAAGVDAVVLVDCSIDLYNPNVIRASQGLVFRLPVVSASAEPLRTWLHQKAIRAVSLTPHAEKTLWQLDLTHATAFVFGAEDKGLSALWMSPEMDTIRIPMAGSTDSLNVSATAAICAFEARRQRL